MLDYSKMIMEQLVKTDEKKIRKSLEDAKKRSYLWCKHITKPQLTNDNLIDPHEAKEYFKSCLISVEKGLVELAQRFSPIQWLWYLRRFPHLHHVEDHSFEKYGLNLAEILATKSQRKNSSKHIDTQIEFPLSQPIANYVLDYVAGAYDLADLHTKYGAASRDVPFRWRSKRLPDPVLSETKRKAGQVFDERQEFGSYGLTGSIPNAQKSSAELEIYFLEREYYPFDMELPYFRLHGLETPFSPSYFNFIDLHLDHIADLYQRTDNANDMWLNDEAMNLIVLSGLLLPIAASTPQHSINIAKYGYSVHEQADFVDNYLGVFEDLGNMLNKMFPDSESPVSRQHFIKLLKDLECIEVSSHPLLPGVILNDKDRIIIDYANVATRLQQILRFPSIGGEIGQKRGIHFEDAIQSYIDASPWNPSDKLKAMRQVHLVRDNIDTPITDIDAIGEYGDTLLIVSCKAIIFSVGQDLGEYFALKNARIRLDEAVIKWQNVKAELMTSPIGQNYDFSRYTKIIGIVCTPNVVYTEDEFSLAYEVDNLRKAATVLEFTNWLQSNRAKI